MVASRLSEGQKKEIVARYRAGDTSTELGKLYGCSANTISRTLKACLDSAEYEQLKQRRGRQAAAAAQPAPAAAAAAPPIRLQEKPPEAEPAPPAAEPAAGSEPAESIFDPDEDPVDGGRRRVWAIDDADDFGDDPDTDDTNADDPDGEDAGSEDDGHETFVTVPVLALDHPPEPISCRPLSEAELPSTAFLLVDKMVELLARPLREFTELGPLPQDEEERQAVGVFGNQRLAKRHCGRNQRVIPLPNPSLLLLTAPYLSAQGISRVVIDGSLYALPEPGTQAAANPPASGSEA
ncbi:hypothetical protein [Cyanobium sp. LEGE 06113]|uniref:hypothetical protein n=1 Tax=Cyanobium sp. LEGE 06113 TaxID=1297573 RepID=UPI0018811F40|nr:hypothetical protein [Cyanobium sp. LEGE 06113]MBE9152615.1 hypothetical protein [Cyanobium sp. LEGE 06113]MBE9153180.1 hypothetical protein [Cyanobium sp. LEGE 06113]